MGLIVDLGQMLEIQMGIDLCGTDIGVAQEFLNGPQITTGFE